MGCAEGNTVQAAGTIGVLVRGGAVRNEARARTQLSEAVALVPWADGAAVERAVGEAEAVVHLAGAPIADTRARHSTSSWQTIAHQSL